MRQRKGAEGPAVNEVTCFFFFHGILVLFCVWDREVFKGFAAKKGSKRYPVELGRAKKGGSTRAVRGNEEAATDGRRRNDAVNAFLVHNRTFTH